MKLAQYIYIYIAEFLFCLIHRKQTVFRATWPETRGTRGHEEEIHSFVRPHESKFFPVAPNFQRRKVRETTFFGEGVSDYSRGLPFALQLCQNPLYSPLDATIMLYYSVFVSILYTRGSWLRCLVHLLLLLHFEETFFTNLPSWLRKFPNNRNFRIFKIAKEEGSFRYLFFSEEEKVENWRDDSERRRKAGIQKYRNLCEQFNFPLDKPRHRSHLVSTIVSFYLMRN